MAKLSTTGTISHAATMTREHDARRLVEHDGLGSDVDEIHNKRQKRQ
jgi:hypothetical protein